MSKVMLRAKFDFVGVETEELSLKSGESVQLLFRDESGWAKGTDINLPGIRTERTPTEIIARIKSDWRKRMVSNRLYGTLRRD